MTTPQQKVITFDEADIHPQALQSGRKALIRSIQQQGINDLNTVTQDQFDRALAAFLLAYNSHVARDLFGISVEVKAVLEGQQIPY